MTKTLYKKLAILGKKLILKKPESPERLAVAPLHITCPHPLLMQNYEGEASDVKTRLLKTAYSLSRITTSLLYPENLAKLKNLLKKEKIFQIIISHKIDNENKKTDFYFGKIPLHISSARKKTLILYINHLPWYKNKEKRVIQKNKNIYSFVLPSWSNVVKEIFMQKKIFEEINILKSELKKESSPQKNLRLAVNGNDCFRRSLTNFRIYLWAKEIFKLCKPEKVFFTWEGHAWERLLIRAARETNNRVRCIGYQHTILFKDSIGPFSDLGLKHNPDEIWTIGKNNEQRLKKAWRRKNIKIVCAGSTRNSKHIRKNKKSNLLLVAPDGILMEAQKLFILGKEVAKQIPFIKVVFRTHPVLPFKEIIKNTKELKKLPQNVILQSKNDPNYINIAKWILYRGSSLVLEGFQKGARPILYEKKNEITLDPIFFIRTWKKKVDSVKKIRKIILSDLQSKKIKAEKKPQIQKKLNHFFVPQIKKYQLA